MKFDFAIKIAGAKKSDQNGTTRILEGADLNMSVDMSVEEMIQSFRNDQVSIDKIITFIKADLPNSIRQCGSAMIDVERENRIMNNELPRPEFKKLLEEKRELEEKLEEKEMQLRSAMADCKGTNEGYQEEIKKSAFLKSQNEYLQKMNHRMKIKLRDWMSEIDRDNLLDEYATEVSREIEKAKVKKQWSETIA